jgi:thiol:disulfide interchange protein DsbA
MFWYGCGTCQAVDGEVADFIASLPPDVRTVRVPGMFEDDELWMNHARLYFALETLGRETALPAGMFAAVWGGAGAGHGEARLADFGQAAEWAVRNGMSREEFAGAWNSPEAEEGLRRALAYENNLKMESVPALGINGRYAVYMTGTPDRFLGAARKLLSGERARLGGPAG